MSRAVLRRIEPGTMPDCSHCDKPVKFQAKSKGNKVVCNVYEGGVWKRVEHFHDKCYEDAGKPYGEAAA